MDPVCSKCNDNMSNLYYIRKRDEFICKKCKQEKAGKKICDKCGTVVRSLSKHLERGRCSHHHIRQEYVLGKKALGKKKKEIKR